MGYGLWHSLLFLFFHRSTTALLCHRPAALCFETGSLRRPAWLGGLPLLPNGKRGGNDFTEPLGHILSIAELAPGSARDQTQGASGIEPRPEALQ